MKEPVFLKTYQKNPLLMTDSKEALLIMKNTPSNVNLLIDVAHLKVSSKTLKFNPIKFLKDCDPWIKGYHLSDNDGKNDTNEKIKKNSWFWPYLKKSLEYYVLEINCADAASLVQQAQLTKKILNSK